MRHFDLIYDIAADNYGLITAAQARNVGITGPELRRWVVGGRLERRARGVYKLSRYIPTRYDKFAEACLIVGEGSYLYGEAVLAMFELALVNPVALTVATSVRRRKRLPDWVRLVPDDGSAVTANEGIPSQRVADAIRSCKGGVIRERLAQAIEEGRGKGLITQAEYRELKGEFS